MQKQQSTSALDQILQSLTKDMNNFNSSLSNKFPTIYSNINSPATFNIPTSTLNSNLNMPGTVNIPEDFFKIE